MTQDWTNFEDFLWDSFCDGQETRELRLAQTELSYLKQRYPLSSYVATSSEQSDGKTWYLITLCRRDPVCASA